MTDTLFTPLTLRDTEFRNRVMLSPMCQYSADDGLANNWHRVHLGSRAAGGAGVVMTEATAVDPRGRITPNCLGIWSDEHAEAIEPIVEFVRSQGATPGIQLAHAGRKASHRPPAEGSDPIPADEPDGWETLSATDEPYPHPSVDADDLTDTRRLDAEGIDEVIESFAAAAKHAREVGFEVAEVHAAHGYLLHQFCSPVTNDRGDEYGGSFENRTRLLREVVEAVREVWPEGKPVFVRVSATDWLPDCDSWDVDDSVRLAPALAESGPDRCLGRRNSPRSADPERGTGVSGPLRRGDPRGDRRARRRGRRDHGADPRRRLDQERAGRPGRARSRTAPAPPLAA